MKLRKIMAALLSAAMLLTSGCTGFDASLSSLLSPPKLTDQQAEIYSALLNVKGDSVDLSYPASGEYRSAFTIANLDDEPTEEAMVFYRDPSATENGASALRLNFLDRQDGRWVSVLDLPAGGSAVESIRLEKLSGSDRLCIIISYSVPGQQEKDVDVLSFSKGTATKLFEGSYTYLEVKDINMNGGAELFMITKEKGLDYYCASLAGWNEGSLETLSRIPLPPQAVSFVQTAVAKISDKETAVFIDYGKGDSGYGTEVLYCYDNTLTSSGFSPDTLSRRTGSFTPNLICCDIDGDGEIEIPTTTPFLGYENKNRSEQVNMVTWYEIREKQLEKDFSSYFGMKSDFMVKLPSRWLGMVTATVSGDELRFIEHIQDGEILLTVKAASPEAKVTEGWELYHENERTGYQYFIIRGDSSNSMCLTDAELSDCLVFFE